MPAIYKRNNSPIYWVDINVPGFPRVRQSTGTDDPVEAQRIHDEIRAKIWTKPKGSKRYWGEAVALWASEGTRSESDLQSLLKFAKNFPDRPLESVTAEAVHDALLALNVKPSTYTRYRTRVNAILRRAKKAKWVTDIPELFHAQTKRERTVAKARKWITREEWGKLYVQLPPHLRVPALFSVATGLRQANTLGLEWNRVDLELRTVIVEAEDTKGGAMIPVPLNDEAYELLKSLHDKRPKKDKQTYVFLYRGKPIKEVKTAWNSACVRAGVGWWMPDATLKGGRRYVGFRWHDMRHTWATWHVKAGTPLVVLQKLGGWADLRMVLHYAAVDEGMLTGFVNNSKSSQMEALPNK